MEFSMRSALQSALGLLLVVAAVSVNAQTVGAGPYYATPSWDQTLPASTRFIVLTNLNSQAVLDRETGLVWERAPSTTFLPLIPASNEFTTATAVGRCALLKVGGRYGWRLPTIQELHSLIDDTQDPALPAGNPFTGISGSYWTSTHGTAFGSSVDTYIVSFNLGGFGVGLSLAPPNFGGVRVWCVRGGSGADIQ